MLESVTHEGFLATPVRLPTGQAMHPVALGAPLLALDVYLAYGAPRRTHRQRRHCYSSPPRSGISSLACAHLATLRHVPPIPARRAAPLLVSRFGTRLSSIPATRAGGAGIRIALIRSGGALATAGTRGTKGWPQADSHTSPGLPNHTSADGKRHRSGHGYRVHLGETSHLDGTSPGWRAH